MTASNSTRNERPIPDYFDAIRSEALAWWDERVLIDKHIAKTIRQHFNKISSSPEHVLSELLQNADDCGPKSGCGAKSARAWIERGVFSFEHDGPDFSQREFKALCAYAGSSKQSLHSIGFRGIGFKSTFSLGPIVEVLTPSIAVQFDHHKFTVPKWLPEAPSVAKTMIRVKLRDEDELVTKDLRDSLEHWRLHPVSLLFFRNINSLAIQDELVSCDRLGPGPIAKSERVRLSGIQNELIVIRSEPAKFPPECLEEIREERDFEDDDLKDFPPCTVELVLGLPGKQQLFVVLPAGEEIDTEFSCNAPFIQNFDRHALKPLSRSPTNRWLLARLGELAGESMQRGLSDSRLSMRSRGSAYALLPPRASADDAERTTADILQKRFLEGFGANPILLATDGTLAEAGKCIRVPDPLHEVWSSDEIARVFADGDKKVLSRDVAAKHAKRLHEYGWLEIRSEQFILSRLSNKELPPPVAPTEIETLLALWSFAGELVPYYQDAILRSIRLLPARQGKILHAADEIVRLPRRPKQLREEDWDFLTQRLVSLDPKLLKAIAEVGPDHIATTTLRRLGLSQPNTVEDVFRRASAAALQDDSTEENDWIRLAHIAANLDVRVPEEFVFVTKGRSKKTPDFGILFDSSTSISKLLPSDWASEHLLHRKYRVTNISCTIDEWRKWTQSEKSRLLPFAPIQEVRIEGVRRRIQKSDVPKLAEERSFQAPTTFPYKKCEACELLDYDFNDALVTYWQQCAAGDCPEIWCDLLRMILKSPASYWHGKFRATLGQLRSREPHEVKCGDIAARWLHRFRDVRCLTDTEGIPDLPAVLMLKNQETEALFGTERFVASDLNIDPNLLPLLLLLGVQNTPASIGQVLDRMTFLATNVDERPDLNAFIKCCETLDRVIKRADRKISDEVTDAFAVRPIILTQTLKWARSQDAFLQNTPDEPAVYELVHSSVRHLDLWKAVDVKPSPSREAIVGTLAEFTPGSRLDAPSHQKAREVLKRYPSDAWNLGHWISLDHTWEPVSALQYRMSMQRLSPYSSLTASLKRRTADLRMLSEQSCRLPPFDRLAELADRVQFRPALSGSNASMECEPAWITNLGRCLVRIRPEDDDKTTTARELGVRLLHAGWQVIANLNAVPYIDDEPVGDPVERAALWYGNVLMVRNKSLAGIYQALVDEITASLISLKVVSAISFCIGRDAADIRDYFEEHFSLDEEVLFAQDTVSESETPPEHTDDPNAECLIEAQDKPTAETDKVNRIRNATKEEPALETKGSDFGDTEPRKKPSTSIRDGHSLNEQPNELSLKNPMLAVLDLTPRVQPPNSKDATKNKTQTSETEQENLTQAQKLQIEECARRIAERILREQLGYPDVEQKPTDNPGYDIEARKPDEILRVEVKGHRGRARTADLSIRQLQTYYDTRGANGVSWELWSIDCLGEDVTHEVGIIRIREIPEDAARTKAVVVDLAKCPWVAIDERGIESN